MFYFEMSARSAWEHDIRLIGQIFRRAFYRSIVTNGRADLPKLLAYSQKDNHLEPFYLNFFGSVLLQTEWRHGNTLIIGRNECRERWKGVYKIVYVGSCVCALHACN